MKELSTEEKAKRYDEVVAMAKECITHIPDEAVNEYMLNMFPELKETKEEKDARISKSIIRCLKGTMPDSPYRREYISWLEKQGEQKPAEWHIEDEQNLNACLGYIPDELLRRWLKDVIHAKYDKPINKLEAKFHKGDWITIK